MFNKVFLTDVAERAVSTALQAWAAAFAIPGPDILDSIKIGAVAGLVSIAKAISARKVGDDSASLTRVSEQ
jgi:hypothetical protein